MVQALILAAFVGGCVPTVQLPPLPATARGIVAPSDSVAALANRLAPTLYVQRDEPFPLIRVAAVVHPTRNVIAYHLLWQHDVNGQWLPWAKPSDEEIVWVGYDPGTLQPTELWTYWHHTILHTPWRNRGVPAFDIQWGKHGSLPRGVIESDLPRFKTLNVFFLVEYALLPDIWLGKLAHGGPWGFFHSYGRYRDFSRPYFLRGHLDAVVWSEDAQTALQAVFGFKYSNKVPWPWLA